MESIGVGSVIFPTATISYFSREFFYRVDVSDSELVVIVIKSHIRDAEYLVVRKKKEGLVLTYWKSNGDELVGNTTFYLNVDEFVQIKGSFDIEKNYKTVLKGLKKALIEPSKEEQSDNYRRDREGESYFRGSYYYFLNNEKSWNAGKVHAPTKGTATYLFTKIFDEKIMDKLRAEWEVRNNKNKKDQ